MLIRLHRTGANVGLGKEATRHYVRLGASKVIIACRSVEKGESAKKDIETSTGRKGVLEVWQLDLQNYDSVRLVCPFRWKLQVNA